MDQSIKESIDYKSKKVGKAMDAKEKSMAIMAAGRDATLVVSEIVRQMDWKKAVDESGIEEVESSVREKIKDWRNWFYYNIYTLDPDEQLEQEAKEKGEVNPF